MGTSTESEATLKFLPEDEDRKDGGPAVLRPLQFRVDAAFKRASASMAGKEPSQRFASLQRGL